MRECHLAQAALGGASVSAVNWSGSHSVRLATSGQMLEMMSSPLHTTLLWGSGPMSDTPRGASTHLAQVLYPAEAPWLRKLGLLHCFGLVFTTSTARSGSSAEVKPIRVNHTLTHSSVPLGQYRS